MARLTVQVLAGMLVVACGGGDGPIDPPGVPQRFLTVVSGGQQTALAGEIVPQPLVLRVNDQNGAVVPNVGVLCSSANASVVGNSLVTTDASGHASCS